MRMKYFVLYVEQLMSNSPIIHINRRYHIPLDHILSIKQKKSGRVWVYYIDPKTSQRRIAVAKQDLGTLLTIVNNYQIVLGKTPFLMMKE